MQRHHCEHRSTNGTDKRNHMITDILKFQSPLNLNSHSRKSAWGCCNGLISFNDIDEHWFSERLELMEKCLNERACKHKGMKTRAAGRLHWRSSHTAVRFSGHEVVRWGSPPYLCLLLVGSTVLEELTDAVGGTGWEVCAPACWCETPVHLHKCDSEKLMRTFLRDLWSCLLCTPWIL